MSLKGGSNVKITPTQGDYSCGGPDYSFCERCGKPEKNTSLMISDEGESICRNCRKRERNE